MGTTFQPALVGPELEELLADLNGKLPGWAKNESLRGIFGEPDPLNRGKAEGGGFAGASLRKSDNVRSLESDRDGGCLDCGRVTESQRVDRGEDLW